MKYFVTASAFWGKKGGQPWWMPSETWISMKKRSWFFLANPKVAVLIMHSNVTWISMKKLYSLTGRNLSYTDSPEGADTRLEIIEE